MTSLTATRSFSSGARPTVIWTKIAAISTSASRRSAGASSRTYSLDRDLDGLVVLRDHGAKRPSARVDDRALDGDQQRAAGPAIS